MVLQVAGFALTLDMHQQTVELQRQIHDCQEFLSDQLEAIQAAIAGQSEQAAVNQSKYTICALLRLLCWNTMFKHGNAGVLTMSHGAGLPVYTWPCSARQSCL